MTFLFSMKYGIVLSLIVNVVNSKNTSKPMTNCDTNDKPSITRRWWLETDGSYNPTGTPDGTTSLYITFLITKVIKISEIDNEIQLYIKGQATWEDDRIKTNFSSFDITNGRLTLPWETIMKHKIWIPFAFTRDLIKISSIFDGGNAATTVTSLELLTQNPFHNNVSIVRAIFQAQYTVACRFNYENYPIDTQNCPIRLFTEPSQRLNLSLYDPDGSQHKDKINLEHLGFDIATSYVEIQSRNTDDMPSNEIGFDIEFKRIYRTYIYQYYLPCIAIVCVSSLNFVIPMSAIPGRISLLVTNFLTLTIIYINQMVRKAGNFWSN